MSTLFGRAFLVASVAGVTYSADGSMVEGAVTTRTVRGTIQSITAKDTLAFEMGSRDTGKVKVYCSERLSAREQGTAEGDYIAYAGRIYQLFVDMPYLNGLIPHYKYFAELCPVASVTAGVAEALGAV